MYISPTALRNGAVALLMLAGASACSPDLATEQADTGQSPLIAEDTVVPVDQIEDANETNDAADAEVLGTTEENDAPEQAEVEDAEVEDAAAADETATEDAEADESDDDTSELDALTEGTDPEAIEAERPVSYAIVGVPVGLNMRSGPGLENAVVSAVAKDRIVTATGQESGGWLEVQLDGLTGWMSADYLEATDLVDNPPATQQDANIYVEGSEAAAAPATAQTPIGVRNLIVANVTDGVNLRQGPSSDTALVVGVPVNSIVTATGVTAGEWVEVTFNGFTGWTLGQFLNEV